jgi:lipoprotein-anchoring transpeptidase ErfK/SrfK
MLLRLVAAAAVVSLGPAAAQYYPPPPVYGPSPYSIAPPMELEEPDERSVISSPNPLPPEGQPGFNYPNRDPAPPPYGHMPSRAMQQDGVARGEPNAPRPPVEIGPAQESLIASLPPEDQPEVGEPKELPPQFRRQQVEYRTKEPAGTIVVDTANTYLYLVLGNGQAMRYGIGVGREGFTWSGTERVSRVAEWPDWYPPQEMIERQPYLPRFMAGGPGNPLGARALYLGKTLFRIHGTNQPSTIGQFVSSGCVRLVNDDIEDLYERVKVGTRVVVLPGNPPATAQAQPPQQSAIPIPSR